MRQKLVELIDFQDAVNNLVTISSMNMESPPPLGIVDERRFVVDTEDFGGASVQWLSGEGAEEVIRLLDRSYRSLLSHLQMLYDNPEQDWESKKSKEGTASLMVLVGESHQKMNRYLAYRLGDEKFAHLEDSDDLKALQKFYSEVFAKRFSTPIEGKEAWREEWDEKSFLAKKREFIDFEEILQDREYELFFLRDDKNEPIFDRKSLQNVKLTVEFDVKHAEFEEDPFLKVRAMQDRDLNVTSQQILRASLHEIEAFYAEFKKMQKSSLSENLSKAVLALFLSANPRHLMTSTSGKTTSSYFRDFYSFLRLSLQSNTYQKWMVYPPEKEKSRDADLMLSLLHKLCFSLISRKGGVKQEAIGLIHRTMRRGGEIQDQKGKGKEGKGLWDELLLEDEKLRSWLSQFPGGPLLKTVDLIRKEEELEEPIWFDPLFQGNLPIHLFDLQKGKKKVSIYRLPCPTRQLKIDRADVVDEFRGFLRFISHGERKEKHLMVHFQDRLSWKESARSLAIEALQKIPKFASHFFVLTLPKDTDFYHQNKEFENVESADSFLTLFKEILSRPEENGFAFPVQWKKNVVSDFAEEMLPLIHRYFFHRQKNLSRVERQNCIELFYQMLIVKAIDLSGSSSVSFVCKDGVDTSAIAVSAVYGFLKLLSNQMQKKEEIDFLRYLMYSSALFIRERAVDSERFLVAISLLQCVDATARDFGGEIKKAFSIDWEVLES